MSVRGLTTRGEHFDIFSYRGYVKGPKVPSLISPLILGSTPIKGSIHPIRDSDTLNYFEILAVEKTPTTWIDLTFEDSCGTSDVPLGESISLEFSSATCGAWRESSGYCSSLP